MPKFLGFFLGIVLLFLPFRGRGEVPHDFTIGETPEFTEDEYVEIDVDSRPQFLTVAPREFSSQEFRGRSDILPWGLTIANLGVEYCVNTKWSVVLNVWFCPWKISERFSVKTVALLPEGRWWLRSTQRGSFFNVHLNMAWFNVRANSYRYQDTSRPLLGGGIGYGYRLPVNERWAFEFEIGAGVANMKYDRYYNVANGALKDTRVTTYFGIDRASVAITYYLCDL